MGITRGSKCDGSHRASTKGVRRIVVFEQLNIGAELQAHPMIVRSTNPGDNGVRAEGIRDAMFPWELIEASDGVSDHVADEEARQTTERQTVCAGSEPFLHSTNGTLDLANVAVGGDDVQGNGEQFGTSALELVVPMDVSDRETTGCVAPEDVAEVA